MNRDQVKGTAKDIAGKVQRKVGEATGDTEQQIKGGASNPTFKLTTQGAEGPQRYVLRKKPPGQLLASAHQVDREHRVMKALESTGVPVPRMRHLCDDASIIGTAFYVMDFLDGRIFRDATLPGLLRSERSAIYDELNATLAKLHQVDYVARGLSDFGRPGGYFCAMNASFVVGGWSFVASLVGRWSSIDCGSRRTTNDRRLTTHGSPLEDEDARTTAKSVLDRLTF